MGLSKLALSVAVLLVGQTAGDVKYTNLTSGRIPAEINNPQRRAEIKEMHLYLSADEGKTWDLADKTTPDKGYFSYFTQKDGVYWCQVVVVNQQGKQEPTTPYQAPPTMKLIVDTVPPALNLTAQRQGDEVVVQWSVTETHPDPTTFKLEYRTADSPLWTAVPAAPAPLGSARAKVPSTALVVRISLMDMAKNSRVAEAHVAAGTGEVAVQSNVAMSGIQKAAAVQPALPDPPPVAPTGMPLPPLQDKVQPPVQPPAYDTQHTPPPSVIPPPSTAVPPVKSNVIASTTDNSQGSPVPPTQTQLAALAPAARPLPALQIVNDTEIELEYEVSKIGPSGLGAMEFWITRDNGGNWIRYAEDPDASQAVSGRNYKRSLKLPGEGVYGISMVVRSKAGMGKAAPKAGDAPEILVEVDTTPPEAQLLAPLPDGGRRDTLLLSWTAKDRNLGQTPITLEWAEQATGPWKMIAADLPNAGRHPWKLPPSLPSHVHLRLTVRDGAGNVAVAVTDRPQLVDMSEPEGRLIRVVPANKKQ